MNDTYSILIKLAARLLTSCPISTIVEDWHLPKYVSDRRLFLLQSKLDALDSWHKNIAVELRNAARAIEAANTSTNKPMVTED